MIGYTLTASQVRDQIGEYVPEEFVNYSTLPVVVFADGPAWRVLTIDGHIYEGDSDEFGEPVVELPVLMGGQVVTCDVPALPLMRRGVWFDTDFAHGGREFDYWLRHNGGLAYGEVSQRCAPVEPDERASMTVEVGPGRSMTVFVD